ncbi:MAG: hypothetical protein J2P24_15535 [Streptosporangiales bacterium]|nr:hypothetical protein [Streptosporangiales bacterium]MBO0892700.1 hypothetical protein [Acidothermales bacterium]
MADIYEIPDHVPVVGRAVFADHDWESEVLDVAFDSVLDDPDGLSNQVRRLDFTSDDCAVVVEVHGRRRLSVGLTVTPHGSGDVEAWIVDGDGRRRIDRVLHRCAVAVRPGLTSFVVRWPEGEHRPVRTSWVML